MLSTLLNMLRSTAFYYISGTLLCVGVTVLLQRIWQTMGMRFFLLALGGVLLCILLVVAIVLLWRLVEAKRGEKMVQALEEDAASKQQQRQQVKVAVQSLKERWSEAMATLKATKVKIYDLPWLLLIGEPQSGKTTTLRQSGLDFPLGNDSLSGAGGTVNCDWWFTNEAVILDTAGRFTMPVDSAPDREEWRSFLKLLASHRPRCPINGVIVTIPSTSLLQDPPETLQNKALMIREKLQELVAVLGVEFPVYIMVSKLDLVYGFAEFCASLSSEERKQALGWNRQDLTSGAFNQEEFNSFFAALIERLDAWARRRLREMPPGTEADRVYCFPGEFGRLKETMAEYLSLIFRPDRYHAALLFRGCYFSSGLQEGKSIARALLEGAEGAEKGVMAEFAKSFVQSRAYFINIFYRKVFRERWLVRRAGGATKREILLRLGAAGFATLFCMVAASLLFSGYRSLATKVKPLDTEVRKAETILVGDGMGQQVAASRIIQEINTLEAGRQELIQHGARRFLRTRKNALVNDIGRIQDALFERRLLDILVGAAGGSYVDDSAVNTVKDKERLYTTLLQYIDIYSGKPVTLESMSSILNSIQWKSPQGVDIDRVDAERVIQAYPFFQGDKTGSRYLRGGVMTVRQMLTLYHQFWSSYYARFWQEQKRQLALINSTYGVFLGTGSDERSLRSATAFKDAVDALDPELKGKILVWTDALEKECNSEYRDLHRKLSDAGVDEIVRMADTAERHATICPRLKTDVGREWAAEIPKNPHILAPDGTINPQMYLVRGAVMKAVSFGPLFTAEMEERLKSEAEKPLPLLDTWHRSWQADRELKMTEIEEDLKQVTSEGWHHKELLELCDNLLAGAVLRADQDVAMAAIRAILPREEVPGIDMDTGIPAIVRGDWLASRFSLLQKVGDWLQMLHPDSPGLATVRSIIDDTMSVTWANCLEFWAKKLDSVDVDRGILATTSWKGFRKEVLNRNGVFLDRGSRPLKSFFAFMGYEEIEKITSIMGKGGTTGSLLPEKARMWEQRVVNTSAIYSPSRFLHQLDEAQSNFNSVLENLSDNALVSWQMLKDAQPGGSVTMEKFKSLGAFQQLVSRDPAGRDEPMAMQLAKIQEHADKLLQRGFSSGIGNAWGKFIGTWRGRLGNRYPFGYRDHWARNTSTSGDVRKLVFNTEAKNDLYDFFFSPNNGLESFMAKYNLAVDGSSTTGSAPLNRSEKAFLENCLAWRDFLFERDKRPRKHQIRITLDDQQGQHSLNAQKYFTQLTITGLEYGSGQSIRLRFSGQRYKSADTAWQLGLNPDIYMEARNEETGLTTAINLSGGGLTFPAYVVWEGRRRHSKSSGDLRLNMLFPRTGAAPYPATDREGSISSYIVPISVSWDQALPANIVWPAR